MAHRISLAKVVDALERAYGRPDPPEVTDPFEMILFENAAYLVDDDKRLAVWNRLRRQVGVSPGAILNAPQERLLDAIREGGMQPERRAEKLRTAAKLADEITDGSLHSVLGWPSKKARAAFKKFPGIGDPGADKIMLFSRTEPVLALESNGLRVLLRLGYGKESANYATAYRSVQRDISGELRQEYDWLISAHQLLRRHGQSLCKRESPHCGECPLRKHCPAAEQK